MDKQKIILAYAKQNVNSTCIQCEFELANPLSQINESSAGQQIVCSLCEQDNTQSLDRDNEAKGKQPFMFAGIVASILGSIFFSISLLCIKLLPNCASIQDKTMIIGFRGLCMMFFCGFTKLCTRSSFTVKKSELKINILRWLFAFLNVYGAYMALEYISMGDSTALVFSSPVWTSILSHFILKEQLHWVQLAALPASSLGIILIAHPALIVNIDHVAGATERQPILMPAFNFTANMELLAGSESNEVGARYDLTELLQAYHLLQNYTEGINADLDSATMTSEHYDLGHRWPGIVIAIATSFLVSAQYIVFRIRASTPIQTTTYWLGFFTAVISLLINLSIGFGHIPVTLVEWTLLIGNGFCSWLGQILLQWALLHENASILSVVRTLDVAMTFSLSAVFLEEDILWTSVVGAIIIGLVVITIMVNNWFVTRRTNNKADHKQDVVGGRNLKATLGNTQIATTMTIDNKQQQF